MRIPSAQIYHINVIISRILSRTLSHEGVTKFKVSIFALVLLFLLLHGVVLAEFDIMDVIG